MFPFFYGRPGRISTSSPTARTPESMEPPTTPPRSFSGFSPGLFTSKDLGIRLAQPNYDHLGGHMELTIGDREKGAYLLQHVVKVVAELSRDGDYGGFFSDGALDKPLNFLVVADSSLG